jgi:hypothetical protein
MEISYLDPPPRRSLHRSAQEVTESPRRAIQGSMTRTRRTPGGPPIPAAEPGRHELHAYVGRQAIFDRRLNVVGYELLYRDTVRHQNRGDLSSLAGTGLSARSVVMAWYESVRWADDIMRRL